MSFKNISVDIMLKGTLLAIVERRFPEGLPSLKEYSRQAGVATSTFRRAANWLLSLLPGLFEQHRPGPRSGAELAGDRSAREAALRQLEDLRSWLGGQRRETTTNSCYLPEAKQRIAATSEEIHSAGTLSFEEIADHLGLNVRQLNRLRTDVASAGGEAPQEKSRRPDTCTELATKIQELIQTIAASANSRNPYGPTDVKRILDANYKLDLIEHHGAETIAVSTVSKYMSQKPQRQQREHLRGAYRYPQPFQQVAIDTSHFKLFGVTFYFITVFEMAGRLNLLTRVFLWENTAAVVSVVEEYLERYPTVEVMVFDRGTPYLNEEVRDLLESNGRMRLVCPPATPTAKAACERHFRTLKEVIARAAKVALKPPLADQELRTALEFGVAVFCELYHQIPQEGIDGKSPAERIAAFDPERACASMIDLFERALDSEPVEDFARRLHARFQIPGPEEETVKRLRQFGTPVLRRLLKEVEPFMGPPLPHWMYDALGYLATKARGIFEEERRKTQTRRYEQRVDQRQQEEQTKRQNELEDSDREWHEHPERFVDRILAVVVRCAGSGFASGLQFVRAKLQELLKSLETQLGHAFANELSRIRQRIDALTENSTTRTAVNALVDEILAHP